MSTIAAFGFLILIFSAGPMLAFLFDVQEERETEDVREFQEAWASWGDFVKPA